LDKIEQIIQTEEDAKRAIEQAHLDAEQTIDDAREQSLTLVAESAKVTEKRCDEISEQIRMRAREEAGLIKDAALAEASFVRAEAEPRIAAAVEAIIETFKG
jgi:vacuolar-type H+-ATPase subunit H